MTKELKKNIKQLLYFTDCADKHGSSWYEIFGGGLAEKWLKEQGLESRGNNRILISKNINRVLLKTYAYPNEYEDIDYNGRTYELIVDDKLLEELRDNLAAQARTLYRDDYINRLFAAHQSTAEAYAKNSVRLMLASKSLKPTRLNSGATKKGKV